MVHYMVVRYVSVQSDSDIECFYAKLCAFVCMQNHASPPLVSGSLYSKNKKYPKTIPVFPDDGIFYSTDTNRQIQF